MKKTLTLSLFCLATLCAAAQMDNKSVKKLEKAEKLVNRHKFDDAEKIYRQVVKEHPGYATAWNTYTEFARYRYEVMSKQSGPGFKISVNSGDSSGSDSLVAQLTTMLARVLDPGYIYHEKFMDVCREATLRNEYCHKPSFYLRNSRFDKKVDEHISDSALREFNRAEKQFVSKNFVEAIRHYQNAAAVDSHFYKAKLYIGDSYFALKDYVSSITYFRKAVEEEPTLLEPRKYLVNALINIQALDEAYEECIQALMLYPDIAMFGMLDDIATKKGKTFDRNWMPRELYPNTSTPVLTTDKYWRFYADAKNGLDTAYYDKETGLINPNPATTHKYLEVYCWEQLLKNSPPNTFGRARAMQEKGYLDCYVLFSLYHIDAVEQYKTLAKTDRSRLRSYIDLLVQ